MSPFIEERVDDMTFLCLRHGVQRLDLFGAAASDAFRPGESDLDFLVEFRPSARDSYADAYVEEDDCETLLDALDKRNLLSHTYQSEVAREADALIKDRYYPVLLRLHRTLDARRTP